MGKGFVGTTVVLTVLDLIAVIVSVVSDYWAHRSEGIFSGWSGLWNACGKMGPVKACGALDETAPLPDEYKVVRALMLTGLALVAIALLSVLMRLLIFKESQKLLPLGVFCLVFAGLCLAAGLVFYYTDIFTGASGNWTLHVGFILGAVASVLAFICAVLMHMLKTRIGWETAGNAVV